MERLDKEKTIFLRESAVENIAQWTKVWSSQLIMNIKTYYILYI